MKRFILPILMIVVGGLLFIPYTIVNSDPSTHPTGFLCDATSPVECSSSSYDNVIVKVAAIGVIVGVVSIPSGVAIGIYRLVKRK